MDIVRLDFRYKEALRQRASKAKLLAELIVAPHKKEEDQKRTNQLVERMLYPHGKHIEVNQKKIDDTWSMLRAAKGRIK